MNLSQLKNSRDSAAPTQEEEIIDVTERMSEESLPRRKVMDSGAYMAAPQQRNVFSFLWAHKFITIFLMLLSFGSGFYYVKLTQLRSTGLDIGVFDPFKGALNVIAPPTQNALAKLDKTDNRTNVLLLGVDARDYNESYLTDSIMLLSYDHNTKETAQISFPRDLRAKYTINGKSYADKINSVFPLTYNQTKSFDSSFENLGKAVEQISSLPVHYGVLINFRGFQQIIDKLGGVSIDVENSFTDYEYPRNDDKGYEVVSFKKGVQTMNGNKALQYARSRHSLDNGEGSDFSRARRQQKVVNAVKEKIIGGNLFTKADTLNDMITTLGNNIKFYHVGGDEITTAIQGRDILKDVAMYSMVIDPTFGGQPNKYLTGQTWPDNGSYEVRPNKGTYTEVQSIISFFFENSFLLKEKPATLVAWTNAKRYKDYLDVKELLKGSNLEYEYNEPYIKVAAPVASGTPVKTVTPTGAATTQTVTIYKLVDTKSKSVEFYKKLLKNEDYVVEVKEKTELPKELEKLAKDEDVLIVLE
jgi:LCP family protein required for cell wall assembly